LITGMMFWASMEMLPFCTLFLSFAMMVPPKYAIIM
jgi:hypothetical protein